MNGYNLNPNPWFSSFFRTFLSAGACLLTLVSCQKLDSSRPDLIFINGAEPETLDPALITGQPEGRITHALFEGLTAFDASGHPQPGMAERWTISDDQQVYRFFLRKNASWSDGSSLTAHDFYNSWERTLNPVTASEYSYQLHYIRNAKAYNEGTLTDFSQVGIRVLDSHTLEVELENATPFFLDLCATPPLHPVPIEIIEKFQEQWVKPRHIIGNGAYILKDWRLNRHIELVKNPHYWNKDNVGLHTIRIVPTSKANTAFNLYASGQADLILDKGLIPTVLISELRSRPDFHSAPYLATYFLRFNTTKPPFDDPRIRQAFSLAIHKSTIAEKIAGSGESPAHGFVPPGTGTYSPASSLPHDPEQARQLLAEAGFPNGNDFPIIYYLYSQGELNEAIAIELQSTLKRELNIQIQLARQEWKVYLNSLSTLDYHFARSSWIGDYNDPNTFLDMFVTGNGNNRTGYSNPKYDALIAAAASESNPETRNQIFHEAESLLLQVDAPICPLYHYVGIQLYSAEKFGGILPNVLDEHPFKNMFRISAQ